MLFFLILLGLAVGVGVPALIAYLVIRYVFELRQRQNDVFLNDLGHVIHKAVSEALKDAENKND